jgi:hypothetical protein
MRIGADLFQVVRDDYNSGKRLPSFIIGAKEVKIL